MSRLFFAFGSGFALIAVITGAFAAHALKTRLSPDMFQVFEVAVRYQMYHALGLIAGAWAASQWSSQLITASGWLFVAGIVIFSGSLYILSLTGVRWLGAITPIGGVAFIIGWGCLLWVAIRG
ncbi:DUF423 domain-containing protein [Candidatus Poribacteria bacterium]|nr:MAG: DUF423 domain-containing protein [Candidatus Poribacteria bacterium]